ncbi:hypothetical protein [Plantibacter flavus]|uniref:hypothetical protein n=1 Tax=Plantibacter flavus TaxID=150123 RepID=UPI0012947961|nr:hypothetical protein [Plantibacter flavus]
MATIITGPVPDSAGQPADGRLEFRQEVPFASAAGSATQALAIATVRGGEIVALDGGPFTMPPSPPGTAVVIIEALRGRASVRRVAIPDQASVLYMDLLPPVLGYGEIWYVELETDPVPEGAKPGDWLYVGSTNMLYLIGE